MAVREMPGTDLAPLFHVGYHKTGTTFLQKEVFEAYKVFHRVPQREIFWNIIFPNSLEYKEDNSLAFVQRHVTKADRCDALPVFSNERLSGGHHTGGHDALELAARIKACAPNARIVFLIREQKSLLLSLYAQYVKGMGCLSLAEYCDPRYTTHTKELFNPVTLEFDRLISEYMRRFHRVLVLPFELLKADPNHTIMTILDFAGVSNAERSNISVTGRAARNVSRSATVQRVDRFFHPFRSCNIPHVGSTYCNSFSRTFARSISGLVKNLPLGRLERRLRRKDEAFISKFVANRYSESNQRLSEMIDIDLQSLGYT